MTGGRGRVHANSRIELILVLYGFDSLAVILARSSIGTEAGVAVEPSGVVQEQMSNLVYAK